MNASAITELKRLIGEANVREGASAVKPYFPDVDPGGNLVLATPETPAGLSDVAYYCHNNGINIYSVKRVAHGKELAGKDGVLIDTLKLTEIKKIDSDNLAAFIYGGVTFEQLTAELNKYDRRLLLPISGETPYVLRSYMERDTLMGEGGNRHPHVSIFHAMMANGEKWVSGSQQMTDEGHADFREDQGPQYSPFFGASEDIYGIPYYGIIYAYPRRELRRALGFTFDNPQAAADFLYKINRAEWCFESVGMNTAMLSTVLADGNASEADKLRGELAPWTVYVSIEQYAKLVELWTTYIGETASGFGGKPASEELVGKMEKAAQKPMYLYNRNYLKGRTTKIDCYQYAKNVSSAFDVIDKNVANAEDLGKLILPVYFGANMNVEADIFHSAADVDAADAAALKAKTALLDAKAFFDRPRGDFANLLYSRADKGLVDMLKLFKNIVDPKGTLNPGQLMEGV